MRGTPGTRTRFRLDVLEHDPSLLAEHAEGWTVARMPAVDRTLLRIGVFELLWMDEIDDPVAFSGTGTFTGVGRMHID